MFAVKFYSLLAIYACFAGRTGSDDADSPSSQSERLLADLFKDDRGKLHPKVGDAKPLLVEVSLDNIKLISCESYDVQVSMKLAQSWVNDHFKWSPEDYGDIRNFVTESSTVWHPSIYQLNSVEGVPVESSVVGPHDQAIIHSDGVVEREFWTRTRVPCFINTAATTYPSNSKEKLRSNEVLLNCPLEYGSSKVNGPHLTFVLDLNATTIENSARVLPCFIASIQQVEQPKNSTGNHEYVRFSFMINLIKVNPLKSDSFFGPVVLPCIVFSLLILLQFLIPANIGERVVYRILVLIFLMLYGYFVADISPKFDNEKFWSIPSVYIFCLILGAAAALTNTCLVVNFYHTKHNAVMHDKVKQLFLRYLPRLLCMRNASDDVDRRMDAKRQSTKQRRISDSSAVQAAVDDASHPLVAANGGDEQPAASAVTPKIRWSAQFLQVAWLREVARDVRDLSHVVNVRLAETRGSPQWTYASHVLNRFGMITVGAYIFLVHLVAIIVFYSA